MNNAQVAIKFIAFLNFSEIKFFNGKERPNLPTCATASSVPAEQGWKSP